MFKFLYVLLAVVLLSPGVLAAGFTVYGAARGRARAAAESAASGEPVSSTLIAASMGIGSLRFAFEPRLWAALLVLAGAGFWVVGVCCLLFLPS